MVWFGERAPIVDCDRSASTDRALHVCRGRISPREPDQIDV